MDILEHALTMQKEGKDFAIATIIKASGSTPRSKAKMIITVKGETIGTIGGGLVESLVTEEAKSAIVLGKSKIFSYHLDNSKDSKSIAMECGGSLEIFIEVYNAKPHLLIVGGGHVGHALAELAVKTHFLYSVVDERPDYVNKERFPHASAIYVDTNLENAMKASICDENTCIVIGTHASDERALRYYIQQKNKYLGMLGSRRKVSVITEKLKAEGVNENDLLKLYAPIGLDIGAETPEEIAVSIFAQILSCINNTSATHLSKRNTKTVVVRGAGDLASGIIVRLIKSGFKVIALETEKPKSIRRTVCFSEAIRNGEMTIEGITAKKALSIQEAFTLSASGIVPVLIDADGLYIPGIKPSVVIDAIIAKKNLGTHLNMAPLVIGIGPGFTANEDVHAVVETMRGHTLGTCIYEGSAIPNTGVPGEIAGFSNERVIHAPHDGKLVAHKTIGDFVKKGELILSIQNASQITEVKAEIDGILRGLISEDIEITKGLKIADIDPRAKKEHCFSVSDKARAIAGAVLEIILHAENRVKV